MTPGTLDELRKVVDGLEAHGLAKEDADGLRQALALATSAIPKDEVSVDVGLIERLIPTEAAITRAALRRLASYAASAHDWYYKWERAETLLRECREKERTNEAQRAAAMRGIEEMRGAVAGLEQEKRNALADRDRHANASEVWRKRVHEAAEALADVLPGEVGRLDLVARVNEVKRQRDEWQQRAESLLKQAEGLEAELARLKPSGQVAEEYEAVRLLLGGASSPALIGLAAKAHGYEMADGERRRLAAESERLHSLLASAEHERDAAVAAHAELLDAARRYDAYIDLSEPWSNGDLGIDDASGLNEASAALHALIAEERHEPVRITANEWKAMSEDGNGAALVPPGWTGRDEFAKAALQAQLAQPYKGVLTPQAIADGAYEVADAMLKARAAR